MKSPYMTAEHQVFRKEVRGFIEQEVMPHAENWEKQRFIPRNIWHAMGKNGLLGINYPLTYGGRERDLFFSIVFLEELGYSGYAGFRGSVSVHQYMATFYLEHAGSEFLKRKYLSAAISGEMVAALGITERNAGSDLNQIQTTATLAGDCYLVNGKKAFVTNGTTANFVTLAVRTAPHTQDQPKHGAAGVSLLVVDMDSKGVTTQKMEKIGWHCSDTAEIAFDDVRAPSINIIGQSGSGFYYLMRGFQLERLCAATVALGGMDRCMEETRQYLSRRLVFGKPVGKLQAVRHRIADLVTEIEATRQLIYHTAWQYQNGELPIAQCSMAKLKATELANRVVHECLQLHGGYGYLEESPLARMYRDAPVGTIAGGASEVMRDIIAQITLDES